MMFKSRRRQYRALASAGDIPGLVATYRDLKPWETSPRIEALAEIARADQVTATPLLQEVLQHDEDSVVVLMMLERIGKYRIVGTADQVAGLLQDERPLVAKAAKDILKRLNKAQLAR
jgi:hypothetical protein